MRTRWTVTLTIPLQVSETNTMDPRRVITTAFGVVFDTPCFCTTSLLQDQMSLLTHEVLFEVSSIKPPPFQDEEGSQTTFTHTVTTRATLSTTTVSKGIRLLGSRVVKLNIGRKQYTPNVNSKEETKSLRTWSTPGLSLQTQIQQDIVTDLFRSVTTTFSLITYTSTKGLTSFIHRCSILQEFGCHETFSKLTSLPYMEVSLTTLTFTSSLGFALVTTPFPTTTIPRYVCRSKKEITVAFT